MTSENPAERVAHLFDTNHERLYRLARRLVGTREDAWDLVQETFLRASSDPGRVPAGLSHEEA